MPEISFSVVLMNFIIHTFGDLRCRIDEAGQQRKIIVISLYKDR